MEDKKRIGSTPCVCAYFHVTDRCACNVHVHATWVCAYARVTCVCAHLRWRERDRESRLQQLRRYDRVAMPCPRTKTGPTSFWGPTTTATAATSARFSAQKVSTSKCNEEVRSWAVQLAWPWAAMYGYLSQKLSFTWGSTLKLIFLLAFSEIQKFILNRKWQLLKLQPVSQLAKNSITARHCSVYFDK